MEPSLLGVSGILVGRESEIETLFELFDSQSPSTVIISGINGVGKTDLSNKFARRLLNNNQSRSFITFRISGSSKERLFRTIVEIAEASGIPTIFENKQKSLENIVNDIIMKTSQSSTGRQSKAMLIIDNVNDEEAVEGLREFMTENVKANCFVVVNMNTDNVVNFDPAGDIINISLDVLEPSDSKQVIRNGINGPDSERDIEYLSDTLKGFPLALQTAIACIRMQQKKNFNYKIRNYLEEYERHKQSLDATMLNQFEHPYNEVILLVWLASIENIRKHGDVGWVALKALGIMAYCEPEQIPVEFNWRLRKPVDELNLFRSAMTLLYDYSIIDGDGTAFRIHRLFQTAIRLRFKEIDGELRFLKKLTKTIEEIYGVLKPLDIPHVLSIWKFASKNIDLVKEFNTFPDKIGDKLCEFRMHKEHLHFARVNEELLTSVLGPKHLETMNLESHVALGLRENRMYEESMRKFKENLRKQRSILEKDHSLTQANASNMGLLLLDIAREEPWPEAPPPMIMNGENVSKMMFEMHFSVTAGIKNPFPPFYHNVTLGKRKLVRSIPESKDEVQTFTNICYAKFNEKRGEVKIGTVDYNPRAWVDISIYRIQTALESSATIIEFPNGCCTTKVCPINLLFDIVIDELFEPNNSSSCSTGQDA